MKKNIRTFAVIIFASVILTSCGGGSKNESENKIVNTSVDICKCLTEPGNSQWATENKDACRDAISKELGVENWEKVNFSKEPELNRKWDLLLEKCTGSQQVNTGVEEIEDLKSKIPVSISYSQAEAFMENRCNEIGQTLMKSKTVNFKGTKLYMFLSVAENGYVCISSVSENALEVLAADCGPSEVKIEEWNAVY